MSQRIYTQRWLVLSLVVASLALPAFADEPNELDEGAPPAAAAEAPAAAPAPTADPATPPAVAGDETMQELMNLRQEEETPAPAPAATGDEAPAPELPADAAPSAAVHVDRAVLGVAPGQPKPTLRREGEFVVSRRGRIVRSPDGAHVLLAFEADAKNSPEPPMILQPSQMLETMENIVQQRGDSVVFIVSGQVHTYRGANYLLPTMMKLAVDQGNLQH